MTHRENVPCFSLPLLRESQVACLVFLSFSHRAEEPRGIVSVLPTGSFSQLEFLLKADSRGERHRPARAKSANRLQTKPPGGVLLGRSAQNAGWRALSSSQALIKVSAFPGPLLPRVHCGPIQRTLLPVGCAITESLRHHQLHLEPSVLFHSF